MAAVMNRRNPRVRAIAREIFL